MILGPTGEKDEADLVPTRVLKKAVVDITRRLAGAFPGEAFNVSRLQAHGTGAPVATVVGGIEDADLVVVNLGDREADAAYEIGMLHALGVPHILVTPGRELPFYGKDLKVVPGFAVNPGRTRGRYKLVEHKFGLRLEEALRDFIAPFVAVRDTVLPRQRFVEAATALDAYTSRAASDHFRRPIVDSAGPEGLAAAYYMGAVGQFVGEKGFFSGPCHVERPPSKTDPGGPATRMQVAIDRYIGVLPPADMTCYEEDCKRLAELLDACGLHIEQRIVRARGAKAFRTGFLARADGSLASPVTVVEIPSLVYALGQTRRYSVFCQRHSGQAERHQRKLFALLGSFERAMQLRLEAQTAWPDKKAVVTRMGHLGETLRELGVIAA
ncbi:hypothetical protein GCM10010994_18990 [Chelatococcus reniformis]|uniref:Uncharacterized protein n=1 Tax=Chelatococcus reniformis TaxID=1494448 RepID=A0A916U5D2_9HYPH|nr:hypothetical protein GCM10010994_18990 [Chelatococcus reniformis]